VGAYTKTEVILAIKVMTGTEVEELFGAELVGEFAANTPQWHELRKSGLGGSDVAAVAGVSKWTSAYALWATKSGLIPDDFSDSEAMEWGRLLEPVIRQKFAAKHPEWEVVETEATFRSKKYPWMLGNVDGFINFGNGEWGVLEIKTAAYEDDWANGVPRYYETQVRHYMRVFGLKRSVVAVLFHGNKYQEYELLANDFVDQADTDLLIKFWEGVQTGTAPDWDGSLATYETVRAMHPDIEDSTVELGQLGMYLINAAHDYDAAQAYYNEMKSRTLDALGSAKYGVFTVGDESRKVCYRSSKSGGTPFLVIRK
jgi:putative phage-type endonuclease